MLDLKKIIRTRVVKQLNLESKHNIRLSDCLQQAIWVYDKYGISSRLGSNTRAPLKRLLRDSAVKVPIGRANRVFSLSNFGFLYNFHKRPVNDKTMFQIIKDKGKIDRYELAKELDISLRKLNYRLRKERRRWNVVKQEDDVYTANYFIRSKSLGTKNKTELIEYILSKYPFLNQEQLSLVSGIAGQQLAQPINSLTRQQIIRRGQTRENSPDEIFSLFDAEQVSDEINIPSFVIEKRDALVEITKLERYFEHGEADYWLFIDGLPQAEFDMEKIKGKKYKLTKLRRFVTTTYDLQFILEFLKNWSKGENIKLHIQMIDDPQTKLATSFTQILQKRGYTLKDNHFHLNIRKSKNKQNISKSSTSTHDSLNWKNIGPWLRKKQYLSSDVSEENIVKELGQIDDIQALAYRVNKSPDNIDFENIVYIAGINYRLGFVHKSNVEDILRGWPRQAKFNYMDKKILEKVKEYPTTYELEQLGDKAEIRQRIRYLEKYRQIRRKPEISLTFENTVWLPFDQDLPIRSSNRKGRALAAVGTFLILLLEHNPPLTANQISKYLGISINKLKPLFDKYIQRGKILNGYFFDGISEPQYTVPEILDVEIFDIDEFSAVQRVDILPITDAYSSIHLPVLVTNDSTIQPTKRISQQDEQWMICWDGIPVGYFVKLIPEMGMIDYELELKITKDMVTNPIITGCLQKTVSLFRTWYNEEGRIVAINDIPPSDKKWQDIQFLIESIGIKSE